MHLSHFSDEEEVLIGLGATFQINAILTLCSEDNFELKDLMKQMKGEVISGITSIGSWLVRQGEYKQAENYLERILMNPLINKYEIISCYRALGNAASGQKEYDKALQYYKPMLQLLEEINDQEKIGRAYKSIGEVYWFKKDLDLALDYEQRALDILLPMNHRQLEDVYAIIGNIYLDKDDCVLPLKYFEQSLEVAHHHGINENHPNFSHLITKINITKDKMNEK